MYFGKAIEHAIFQYCNEEDVRIKNQVFTKVVYPALNKLAENVIHNRKFYNYGFQDYTDTKHDLVVHLVERLGKFKPEKGKKAFSYFNQICRNWINAQLLEVRDETYGKVDVNEIDLKRDLDGEYYQSDYLQELKEFCWKWSIWGNQNLEYFYFFTKDKRIKPFTQKDKQIANAIFDLFQKSSELDIIDKKALYIMIRERVNVKTQSITDVVNVLKPLCKDMYFEYKRNGTKYWHRFLYFPEEIEGEIEFLSEL